ncbi:MAG: SDR family NAD(P)-dependent oxidoreductase [Bradyrhizobiaceae bacterium]|nr:MAG: SDR family NAD(P)-dependent oxidoreductase [Bradyrhizobiaceae bacterium]
MPKPSDPGPVLVTGCSTGVGRAAALAFCRAGFTTFATARDPSQLDPLREAGCRTLALDVTDESARIAAVNAVEAEFGAVGILVNNAGYGQYGPLEEISPEAIRKQFETNVFGGLRLAQLVLPAMRSAGRGRIVNVSSVAGRVSIPGGGAYHATKFAIEALADALRPEVQPFGIDVVNILPGPIATHFEATLVKSIPDTGAQSPYRDFKINLERKMREFLRPGRFGVLTPERVARAILKAATATHPRARYSVGLYAQFGPIGRALTPDRLVDVALRRELTPRKE